MVTEFLVVADYGDSAYEIGVTVQVFGRGMHDDVESVFNRALNPWRCKCVIANGDDFVLTRNFRDRVEVDQLQQRIAGRFDPNHARVWFDCALEIRSIGQIDVAKIKIRRATAHFVE